MVLCHVKVEWSTGREHSSLLQENGRTSRKPDAFHMLFTYHFNVGRTVVFQDAIWTAGKGCSCIGGKQRVERFLL